MLAHYAQRLPTVEINNTFYRLPTAALLEGWAGHTHVVRVDATASIGDVSKQIMTGLDEFWAKQPER